MSFVHFGEKMATKSLQIQLIRLVKYVVLTFTCDVIGCNRRPAFRWVNWRSVDPHYAI